MELEKDMHRLASALKDALNDSKRNEHRIEFLKEQYERKHCQLREDTEDLPRDASRRIEEIQSSKQIKDCISHLEEIVAQRPTTLLEDVLYRLRVIEEKSWTKDQFYQSALQDKDNKIRNLEMELRARPSIRDLTTSKLQTKAAEEKIEHLKRELRQMQKLQSKTERSEGSTKSERQRTDVTSIRRDKILSALTIERVDFSSEGSTSAITPEERVLTILCKGERVEDPRASVLIGNVCKDIVSQCCEELELTEVAELLPFVRTTRRLVRTLPNYHAFVDHIEHLTNVAEGNTDVDSKPIASEASLDKLKHRVYLIFQEAIALKRLQTPPGKAVHQMILTLMDMLHVTSIDRIIPKLKSTLANGEKDREFISTLRRSFGLSASATRNDVEEVMMNYLQRLGLPKLVANVE